MFACFLSLVKSIRPLEILIFVKIKILIFKEVRDTKKNNLLYPKNKKPVIRKITKAARFKIDERIKSKLNFIMNQPRDGSLVAVSFFIFLKN